MARRVWVIDSPPLRETTAAPSRVPGRDGAGQRSVRSPSAASVARPGSRSRTKAARDWMHVAAAYVLGPLAVALSMSRRRRIAWAILGGGSAVGAAVLLASWPSFLGWIEEQPSGVHLWLTVVVGLSGAIAVAWSRAIAAAARRHPLRPPAWLRHPRAVTTLGLLVPGLGLQLVGRPRRAAWAFSIVGPLAASAAIVVHWRWLWEVARSGPSRVSGDTLELVFLVAAGTIAAMLLTWLVQALDGARHASAGGARTRSDSLSLALLVALGLLAVMPQDARLAGCLHGASGTLRSEGLRRIPLALCETAARLDPVNPYYVVDAIELKESLGQVEAAQAQRRLLEDRTTELLAALRGGSTGPKRPILSWSSAGVLETGSTGASGRPTTWSRIRTLTN